MTRITLLLSMLFSISCVTKGTRSTVRTLEHVDESVIQSDMNSQNETLSSYIQRNNLSESERQTVMNLVASIPAEEFNSLGLTGSEGKRDTLVCLRLQIAVIVEGGAGLCYSFGRKEMRAVTVIGGGLSYGAGGPSAIFYRDHGVSSQSYSAFTSGFILEYTKGSSDEYGSLLMTGIFGGIKIGGLRVTIFDPVPDEV